MLRQFHFIDQNGKDQGVNVRNRSKELAELLGDVERIRAERKKARSNRNKFGGVEGGAMSGGMSSGSRYGGFGNEDSGGYGAYSGEVYDDGGGYGGNTSGFQDSSSRKDRFEEYDEGDEGEVSSPSRWTANVPKREQKKAEPPKPKEPEIDILGFEDDIPPETPPKELASNMRKPATNPLDMGAADDDDFDDFQTASPTTAAPSRPSIPALPLPASTTASNTQFSAPRPVVPLQRNNLHDLVGFSTISPAPTAISSTTSLSAPNYNVSSPPAGAFTAQPPLAQTQTQQQYPRPTGYQAATPNYFTSVRAPTSSQQPSSDPSARPGIASTNIFSKPAAKVSSSGGDVFGSLWSTASAGAGIKKASTPTSAGPGLAAIQKEKASTQIWGAPAVSSQATMHTVPMQPVQSNGQRSGGGGALDDLLG